MTYKIYKRNPRLFKKSGIIVGTDPGGCEYIKVADTTEKLRAYVSDANLCYTLARADFHRSVKYGKKGPTRDLKAAVYQVAADKLIHAQKHLLCRLDKGQS
jgi:hypothetical protein